MTKFTLTTDVPSCYAQLIRAVRRRDHSAFHAGLRRLQEPLSPLEAFELCLLALEKQLSCQVFARILEHAPPLPSFCRQDGEGLVEAAVQHDRPDCLDLFLRKGGNVNRRGELSPLEVAMQAESRGCVRRLMQEPDLDLTMTEALLSQWGRLEVADKRKAKICIKDGKLPKKNVEYVGSSKLNQCLRVAAPRMLGKKGGMIPKELTVRHAALHDNLPLIRRLCRKRKTIPLEDGMEAIEAIQAAEVMAYLARRSDQFDGTDTLYAVLRACPEVLHEQKGQTILLRYALYGQSSDKLRPWIQRARAWNVLLDQLLAQERVCNHGRPLDAFLDRWRERMPAGSVLTISRHMVIEWDDASCVFKGLWGQPSEELMDKLFAVCRIMEEAPMPGEVSPLADELLRYGGPALVTQQLQPGGLLATEDPRALLDACGRYPARNRALLCAYLEREDNYEL